MAIKLLFLFLYLLAVLFFLVLLLLILPVRYRLKADFGDGCQEGSIHASWCLGLLRADAFVSGGTLRQGSVRLFGLRILELRPADSPEPEETGDE